MDWKNLATAVLIPLVGFALKAFFAWIGFDMDPVLFDTLVAAIVAAFLGLFLTNTGAQGVRKFRNFLAMRG